MKLLKTIFNKNDDRSKVVIKNAFYSFFIKGISIAINFLTIPLVLSFLNTTQYGVWLTLTAILGWFTLFDLGIGNGLRNHLTTSMAKRDDNESKIYVSTTYAALTVIFGSLTVIFGIVHPFINWTSVFNAPVEMAPDLNLAVLFAISFLFFQLVLKLINTVLLSVQRAAMADLSGTFVQIFIFAGLFLLKFLGIKTLLAVSLVYSGVPVAVFLILSLVLYLGKYSAIRPSIKFVKIPYVKSLLKLGLNFFVIQIAALVLYASDNFIITQIFNPAEVTTYNLAFKYFSVGNMAFAIVMAPFWSMTTKAYAEGDIEWIRKSVRRFMILWVIIIVGGVVQLIVSEPLYRIWSNGAVTVPFSLSVTMLIYFAVTNWGNVFATFLNGVGKIRLQLIYSIVGMLINVPLAILFIKVFKFSVIGIPLATIITMIGGNLLATIQYKKITNHTATGIWNS